MNYNKYTLKSQEALQKAQQICHELEHQQIENSHVLKGILEIDQNVLPYILKKAGIDFQHFNQKLEKILQGFVRVQGGSISLSVDAQKTLNGAEITANKMKDEFISIEHLILSIIEAKDSASQLLKDFGLTQKGLKDIIKELRKGTKVTSPTQEDTYNALDKYARNLNRLALEEKLDPVIGRDVEIRRILQILSRRNKNNPILIGEPGTGKTAIAEGLANRLVKEDIPENLKDKIIYSLDISSLIAGAKYKGEFEERLKSVVKEVINAAGRIVLFIDEIHTLVGAGGGEGAMDAANILKPALARGELRVIGATTLDEYQKYFEKDKALERRFQKVMVDEPDKESSISILRGIKGKYESHHKVRIKDSAIISAVELSQRYISDRFLPDKAIDLIDEASSKLRMEINSKPEELDVFDRKIMQSEIELEAIKRENDKDKISILKKELADLKENRKSIFAQWKLENELVDSIQKVKTNIEQFKSAADKAEREGDFGLVAELRYGKIQKEQELLDELQKKLIENQENALIKEEVDSEDIAEVVAKWTGIPVSKMLQSDRLKLLKLEEELHKRVIGQNEAIGVVADAVRRSRADLQDSQKPIGTFLFLGTTGVGKTELAKTLAEFLFNDEGAMTRIDMSEYQEKHAVSRLVGAPPGYVGYEEGGQLTEAVRRKPYSVVLLDEIEKAHPDTFNILLQVLDEGRLTDNKGRVADFRNTIIIMTSNMGAHIIQENLGRIETKSQSTVLENTKREVLNLLKQTIRPEFLNRIDEIVMFTPLSQEEVRQIVNHQLKKLIDLLEKKNIRLEFNDNVIDHLATLGYEPQFGARPIKRLIQRKILNELSKKILSGELVANDSISIDFENNELSFKN